VSAHPAVSKPKRVNARVLVAGAGFAGLAAARALEARGAAVTVVEARDRVGGRVWTIRDGFAARQHAEGGADLIDSTQTTLVSLARELGLKLVHINRRGFGYYGRDPRGRLRVQSMRPGWQALGAALAPLVQAYTLADHRWTGAIASALARQSVASWLTSIKAPRWVAQRVIALRGLFLADPEDLSLLALVDFFADLNDSGWAESYRVVEGNDAIATRIARGLASPVQLGTILRRVRQDESGIVATVESRSTLSEIAADYVVVALPATTARLVRFEPGVPEPQREAMASLRYGPATRVLLQFARRFWNARGRPTAFGSDQPIGAIWDGNEQQKGRAAILSLLAGGGASRELQAVQDTGGMSAVVSRLSWLGRPSPLLASRTITWEDDPWAGGGYAFFDPAFAPAWRDCLFRAHGRVLFAGEHTSIRWQGYMNGAVESGLRAAAEIAAF
jgi:monoamine oxidase